MDGVRVWARDLIGYGGLWSITVSPAGSIYITCPTGDCIYVLTTSGEMSDTLPQTTSSWGLDWPRGICTDSTGRWLFVGDEVWASGRVSMIDTETDTRHIIIHKIGMVVSLDIFQDRYLVIGTWWSGI